MSNKDTIHLLHRDNNGAVRIAEYTQMPENVLSLFDNILASLYEDSDAEKSLALVDILVAAEDSFPLDLLSDLLGIERSRILNLLENLEKILCLRVTWPDSPETEPGISFSSFWISKRQAAVKAARLQLINLAETKAGELPPHSSGEQASSPPVIFSLAGKAAAALGDMDTLLRNALRIAGKPRDPLGSTSREQGAAKEVRSAILPQSWTTASDIETRRGLLLGRVACALVEAGRIQEANRLWQEIKDPVSFACCSAEISDAHIRKGCPDDAATTAAAGLTAYVGLSNPTIPLRILLRLWKALLLAGKNDLVRKSVASITDKKIKATAAVEMVRVLVGNGRYTAVLDYLPLAGSAKNEMALLIAILAGVSRSSQAGSAIAELISTTTSAVIRIACSQSASEAVLDLLEAGAQLRDKGAHAETIQPLMKEAIRQTETAESPPTRIFLELELGPALILHGLVEEAESRLKRLLRLSLDAETNLALLTTIAQAFQATGKPGLANHYLENVRAIGKATSTSHLSAETLVKWGTAEYMLGHPENGAKLLRQSIQKCTQPRSRRLAIFDLRQIGQALGCLRRPEVVETLAENLPESKDKDVLRETAVRQMLGVGDNECKISSPKDPGEPDQRELNDISAAVALTRGIVSDMVRDELLDMICARHLQANRFDAAVVIARELTSANKRELSLSRVFMAMGDHDLGMGNIEHCLKKLTALSRETDRSDYISGMAENLPIGNATLPVIANLLPYSLQHPELVASLLRSYVLQALFLEGQNASDHGALLEVLDLEWIYPFLVAEKGG